MRVLLSTIGSRGDVQPLVALAMELRALGQDVRFTVPPDFQPWLESLGFPVTPIGPPLQAAPVVMPAPGQAPPSPDVLQRLADASVASQFDVIGDAARSCDLIVGAGALQIAAPSVAERLGIPYQFVAYCPRVLPSRRHAPLPLRVRGDAPAAPSADHADLWARESARANATFGASLNAHRARAGLAGVDDVRAHLITDVPWLAADPVLAPWPDPTASVWQPGAWLLQDTRPLSADVEAFLDDGEPPVYVGFGSMRVPADVGHRAVQAVRAAGRRVILSSGWAGLSSPGDDGDVLTTGDLNQPALFRRVAAAVHHGGAGTTAAAALAGVPQVIVPQLYDQYYWAERVEALGLGAASSAAGADAAALTPALARALEPGVAERVRAVAVTMPLDGARRAAERLVAVYN